jgi:uncharacterized protein DUF4186
MPDNCAITKPAPLNMRCTSTDCENGLHCFLQTRKMKVANQRGPCRACGAELVDWPRVHSRDVRDVSHTFRSLRLERIRHHYWHVELTQKAIDYARRKGLIRLEQAAYHQLGKVVGRTAHPREGRQTPWSGNIIHYAQHATASCCRKCIYEWHNIPVDRDLSEDELRYLSELAMLYVRDRIPDLDMDPVKVTPRRQR